MVYTECNPGTCPCGDHCSNQRIQRHEWAEGLQKINTVDRGQGVCASKLIDSGKLCVCVCVCVWNSIHICIYAYVLYTSF